MNIKLPKHFYYKKDDAEAYEKDGILFCKGNLSFERVMYHATYELRGKNICYYCGCELNGKVNIKLMKNYNVKLTKKFNIDFPITGDLKPAIGFFIFIFYSQFLLIYLLIYKMVLLFL